MGPNPIRIYSDRSHYRREHRRELTDMLRPYWKDAPFSDEQRGQMYGLSAEDFSLVDKPEQAQLVVLPMSWNYYLRHSAMNQARDFVNLARRVGRPVLSCVSGDEGVKVPAEFDDVYVVRASGCKSRCRKRQIAQPMFFDDPLKKYPELSGSRLSAFPISGFQDESRPPTSVNPDSQPSTACRAEARRGRINAQLPSVGFCGQASVNLMKLGVDIVRGCRRNIQFYLGWRQEEPQPVYPPAYLRARTMKVLAASPLLKSRFISRARYRDGAADDEMREQSSREFYQNIAETDYTLCVRGGGNFSKRFYETLAMGRIPALVDTDCLLPFEPDLPWHDYIVRVSGDDLNSLPRRIADHFASLTQAGLEEQKRKCRQLWARAALPRPCRRPEPARCKS